MHLFYIKCFVSLTLIQFLWKVPTAYASTLLVCSCAEWYLDEKIAIASILVVDKTWRSVSILVVGFHCCTMGAFSVSVCCMAWWFLQNYSSVAACLVTSTFWMSFLDLSLQDVNHAPREWVERCKSNQGKAEVSCRWQYNNRCWWCVCSLARLLH